MLFDWITEAWHDSYREVQTLNQIMIFANVLIDLFADNLDY